MAKFDRWADRSGKGLFVRGKKGTPKPPKKKTAPVPNITGEVPEELAVLHPQTPAMPTPTQPVVNAHGQALTSPQGAPLQATHRPAVIHHPRHQIAPPRTSTVRNEPSCMLVQEGNYDGYDHLLRQLPDLTAAGVVPDMSDGQNALRMVARPDQGVMSKWQPTSVYYNKETDLSAKGRVDERLGQRYSETLGAVRSSRSTVTPGGKLD